MAKMTPDKARSELARLKSKIGYGDEAAYQVYRKRREELRDELYKSGKYMKNREWALSNG